MNKQPIHGGDIATASKVYGIAKEQWIDLSTGINPRPYPFKPLATSAYTDLPYLDEDFLQAAKSYYGCSQLLATPGSQAVIQNLAAVLANLPLLAPFIGYQEYRHHWLQAQRQVVDYPSTSSELAFSAIMQQLEKNSAQHILVIQPNNPSGMCFSIKQLETLAEKLAAQAYLIVDEAFIDAEPLESILTKPLADNVLVLRSFGKFFGLAGIRLGFVFANDNILTQLAEKVGLWAINGPAQAIAKQAFRDVDWQQNIKNIMLQDTQFIRQVFADALENIALEEKHNSLFSTYLLPSQAAEKLYQALCQHGILTRLLDYDAQHVLLRVGRVDSESDKARELRLRLQNLHEA